MRYTVSNAHRSITLTADNAKHAIIKAFACGLDNVGTLTVREVKED